jgi:hypothetical protein
LGQASSPRLPRRGPLRGRPAAQGRGAVLQIKKQAIHTQSTKNQCSVLFQLLKISIENLFKIA